jgi:hypothetical protein
MTEGCYLYHQVSKSTHPIEVKKQLYPEPFVMAYEGNMYLSLHDLNSDFNYQLTDIAGQVLLEGQPPFPRPPVWPPALSTAFTQKANS